MNEPISRKKALLFLAIGMVVFIGIIALVSILFEKDTNQFGKFIRIQNYDQKVKNLPSDMRDAMESSLYNTTDMNVKEKEVLSKIKDAYIRESSDSQSYNQTTSTYYGKLIVDMESIKQSYQIQYSYTKNADGELSNEPVVVSCLPKEQLKYGEFNCTDLVSEQSSNDDVILQYLPYENFSFSLIPDATQGDTLVIIADLTIPDVDLNGPSRLEVVNMYKQEVIDWFKSKNLNPTKFTIQYNYDENGNLISDEEPHSDY